MRLRHFMFTWRDQNKTHLYTKYKSIIYYAIIFCLKILCFQVLAYQQNKDTIEFDKFSLFLKKQMCQLIILQIKIKLVPCKWSTLVGVKIYVARSKFKLNYIRIQEEKIFHLKVSIPKRLDSLSSLPIYIFRRKNEKEYYFLFIINSQHNNKINIQQQQ